jgi:hypothetical protein
MEEDINAQAESDESTFIGDFELPLDAVVTSVLPVGKDVLIEIKKSERKTYKVKDKDTKEETGEERAYFNFQMSLPDHPGETVFHKFFPTAKNLASRDNTRSYKLFLDKLGLPYTTHPANNAMAGIRFIAVLKEDKTRGEYVLASIKGLAS